MKTKSAGDDSEPITMPGCRAAKLWSAVTCHRFARLADLSANQRRVQRRGEFRATCASPAAGRSRAGNVLVLDGDKSPAESADKSAHSKAFVFWLLCILALMLLPICLPAATNDLTSALQQGLFEEEANRNLEAAAQAYRDVSAQFDKDRKVAATAVFRLGEIYRKQGKTNEAVVQYERIVREFSDQETLATLSRQNLTGLGATQPSDAVANDLKSDRTGTANEGGQLAAQLTALERLKGDPEKQARAVYGMFPDEGLATMLQNLPLLKEQLARLGPNPVRDDVKSWNFTVGPNGNSVGGFGNVSGFHPQKEIEGQLSLIAKRVDFILGVQKARLQVLQAAEPVSDRAAVEKSAPSTDDEEKEIRRIQVMIQNSPDLINAPDASGTLPLIAAAGRGQLRVAQFLLDSGAGVNRTVANGITALHAAAENGHKAMVELLLARDAAVNAKDSSLRTALHRAAEKNYRTLAEVLVARNADVNAPDSRGYTPLHLAVEKGHDEFAQLLLEHGAAVNARNQSGRTPLILAAQRGYQTLVAALLAAKAEPNIIDFSGRTALSLAVGNGHADTVKTLLDAKADSNGGTSDLPLAVASNREGTNIANLLLHAGADPNREAPVSSFVVNVGMNYSEWTSLQIAVTRNRADLARLFFQFKADPKAVRQGSGSPLVWDTFANAELLKVFLDAGADPNAEGGQPNRNSLLYMTASVGNAAGVEALLAAGARVNPPSDARDTPLHIAVQKGDEKTVRLLLDAGAEVNRFNREGVTPLWSAVLARRTDVAALLLARGADPNLASRGSTPLHFAVGQENRDLVQLLLTNKADVNIRDNAGKTPLDYAKEKMAGPRTQGSLFGAPPPSSSSRPDSDSQPVSPAALADLLRQHGALDELPFFDRIEVRRPGFSAIAFQISINGWNEFSLLELLAQHYGFITTDRNAVWEVNQSVLPSQFWSNAGCQFPDLSRVVIRRPDRTGPRWTEIPVNAAALLDSGDCSRDVKLQPGDIVEILEADHPVNEKWAGLPEFQLTNLLNCVSRTVTISVKGTPTEVELKPDWKQITVQADRLITLGRGLTKGSFMLKSVLAQSRLLRASSDMSRVKVTRRVGDKTQEWVLNCGSGSDPDLWLRDGDVIEVPDKP